MPRVDLGDFTMFYTDEGSGPPVLLVHGWTCDGSDWSWQIPALRTEHRVLAVDIRGHGRSSVPAEGYSPLQFAHDIAALLDHLSTGPVVAAGHSLGGQIVSVLAVERPDLVRAVVPVDAAYGWGPQSRESLTAFSKSLAGPDVHSVAAGLFSSAFYPPASPPHLAVLHTRRLLGMDGAVISKTFNGLVEGPGQWSWKERSEELLPRIKAPALTFRGGGDPSSVAAWERTVFRAPGSKCIAWEGSGHFLHQERPAEFNAVLLGWLATLA